MITEPRESESSNVSKSFRFVDLFAGIGGFHAVLGAMGGELAVAAEIDGKARETFAVRDAPSSDR